MYWPVAKDIRFKDISFFSSGSHVVQPSVNFGRGQHEKHICEIILILDQWFRKRFHLNIFYLELWHPRFWQSKIICAMKLF